MASLNKPKERSVEPLREYEPPQESWHLTVQEKQHGRSEDLRHDDQKEGRVRQAIWPETMITELIKRLAPWLRSRWQEVSAIAGGLMVLLWWTKRKAVGDFKRKQNNEANRRSRAANDAAADALRLDPTGRDERMREKGWYRD